VCVVRLWEVPMFLKPEQISSVEMVLVDFVSILFVCVVYLVWYLEVISG